MVLNTKVGDVQKLVVATYKAHADGCCIDAQHPNLSGMCFCMQRTCEGDSIYTPPSRANNIFL